MQNKLFLGELSTLSKIVLKILEITSDRGLVLQHFEETMNLVLQYLMLVLKNYSLDFCVHEYVDVEFLFLFGETSANRLEI